MGLIPMPLSGDFTIVTNCDGEEMILDIWVFHPFIRADEGGGFKLVRGAKPGFCQQPFSADTGLGYQIPIPVKRDRLDTGLLDIQLQMVL